MDDEVIIPEEVKVMLRERQTELVKLIEALSKLENSKEWETLKNLVFDKSLANIEKQILNTALAKKIDTDALYKLQGEWAWAKQYNDVGRFGGALKEQLVEIKRKLK